VPALTQPDNSIAAANNVTPRRNIMPNELQSPASAYDS
jgi:hypothetical protein